MSGSLHASLRVLFFCHYNLWQDFLLLFLVNCLPMTVFTTTQNLLRTVVVQSSNKYPYKSVQLNVKIRLTSILAKSIPSWMYFDLSKFVHFGHN